MRARVKFWAVFAIDQRSAGKARFVKAASKPVSTKPGEIIVQLALDVDERAFGTLLATPLIEVNADDVAKPKLVVVKEPG